MNAATTAARTISITLPLKDEFLSDIITNASETSYGWFTFDLHNRMWKLNNGQHVPNGVRFNMAHDGDLCIACPLRFDEPKRREGNMRGRFTLDFDAVAEGIRRIVSGEVKCGMTGDIGAAVAAQDAGMIDANLGDLIVQAAVFKEIVYG